MPAEKEDLIKRIAIVGGGLSGCSTAYFLRYLLGKAVGLTIFEKSERIGGRVRTITVDGGKEMYETGGSIYTSTNRYMGQFVKQFGLSAISHAPPDEALSLYSGRLCRPAFVSSKSPLFLNRLRFAISYGVDLILFRMGVSRYVRTFDQIYDLQKKGHSFDSPLGMLEALSPKFVNMLQCTFDSWLEKHLKLSERFRKEVVYGLVSNCYCSDLTIQAFAGMTAVSGFGAALYSVVGGNEKVAQKLCESALQLNPSGIPREVLLNTTVTKLSRGSRKRFLLTYKNGGVEKSEEFDFVVLALPFHDNAPALPTADKELANCLPPCERFTEVDFTHFRGELEAAEFSLPTNKVQDRGSNAVTILPTFDGYETNRNTLFKYLGRAWSVAEEGSKENSEKPVGCWSAFSVPYRAPEPSQLLMRYAKPSATIINSSRWFAYANFPVVQTDLKRAYAKFLLRDGLIYANAVESLASNMELALIGGHNAALLIAHSEDFKAAHQQSH